MGVPEIYLRPVLMVLMLSVGLIHGRIGFEKLTDLDYRGTTYYTIRNLSLYECQGWCREEPDCAAASFSFVVNPLAPVQETVCLLQNATLADNPTSTPQKAVSSYYMVKLNIRSENVCQRPWTFERVPNKMLSGLDNALVFTATKESCLAACLNEKRFTCRSAEYNYVTTKCHLSEHDRRSVDEFVELVDAQGVDYFENLCLKSGDACRSQRAYAPPQLGVAEDRVAQHVDIHYYVDKELVAGNEEACARACTVENEFLCRSYLYKENTESVEYNCQLFHLDHHTLPDGPSTFLNTDRPLLDDGEPIGKYVENVCQSSDLEAEEEPEPMVVVAQPGASNGFGSGEVPTVGIGAGSGTSSSGSGSGSSGSGSGSSGSGSGSSGSGSGSSGSGSGSSGSGSGSNGSGSGSSGSGSGSSGSGTGSSGSGSGSNGSGSGSSGSSSSLIAGQNGSGSSGSGSGFGGSGGGSSSSLIAGQNGSGSSGSGSGSSGSGSGSAGSGSGNTGVAQVTPKPTPTQPTPGLVQGDQSVTDINCDRTGTCYDVAVQCRDTKIEVLVKTNKPFNGRVYALGRSETCNVDIQNSDAFRLDLTMTGGDCNTQSMAGMFTNTIVLQHHSVVMTKADKIYKIKCTYDMSPRNVSFGMMPIRDPDMISITSAPAAPPPRIRIIDPSTQRDVETVRIGDRLIFRIEIPGNTPYGIFARGCMAMAKDSKSTFQIIDDEGCPVDPTIFPRFVPEGTALQSTYEAFRFTESYGVIFQCNVRYCLGPCEPAVCPWGRDNVESWGRRRRHVESVKRNISNEDDEDMNISQEILVLDFGDDDNRLRPTPITSVEDGGAALPARTAAVAPENYRNNSTYTVHEEMVTVFSNMHHGGSCPTRASVLALSVTCALLLLIYVCTVFYFLLRRWMSPPKHV